MKFDQIDQPNSSSFLVDFHNQKEELLNFFHFLPNEYSYKNRALSLKSHPVNRGQLTKVIREYMAFLPQSDKVDLHLGELEKNALVVIGGQQAGLLTGPMYSIHKAISIVLLAKQQREALGIPVIPVFWIAGEDHDLDEINSTFTPNHGQLQKHTYNDRPNRKQMASHTAVEVEKLQLFIRDVFKQFTETTYTKQMLQKYLKMAQHVSTYSEFFTVMMHDFFAKEGLLLIDAAYQPLRQYESPYFVKMIEHAQEIASLVVEQETSFQQAGYGQPIQASKDSANLFIVENGERFLLKHHNGVFVNEVAGYQFSKLQLLDIAKNNPERLSNNVVTRPLMQEMVFPVLAFVGGPGELAYWAAFKTMFEHFDMELPVMVPRLSITLVDGKSSRYLDEIDLRVESVFNADLQAHKQAFMNDIKDVVAEEMIQEMKLTLIEQYQKLEDHLAKDKQLNLLTKKNLQLHDKQFTYLSRKIEDTDLLRHEVKIRKYNHIEGILFPEYTLQERWFSPLLFLNEVGPTFIEELLSQPFEFNGKHTILSF
ncbi:bacillithiol biosynthesis cysteine-adding enzyme BshC [Paenisporosarcina sp. TG-14]|uniref:bacillithiol biosynthesis cysteine-adding enzyme BshC n=1 Tax=Paenisporosarcina sp. TG-14 TaxID=1231057 RepID=UPI000309AFB9|nr:bacillithiol biosynthesis cysteine-adding enzyme BshC [Paenisporosarcina sp. TG-14]